MREAIEFLNANAMGFLATEDQGKPHVRPWGFMLEQDGKLWFCTANTKDVYQQLQENPAIEFCSSSQAFKWLRVSGKAVFSTDLDMKKKILDNNSMVKGIYQTHDNPAFEIFCLEHGEASIADFSGQPPKKFSF